MWAILAATPSACLSAKQESTCLDMTRGCGFRPTSHLQGPHRKVTFGDKVRQKVFIG
jgi:hypothetical protein